MAKVKVRLTIRPDEEIEVPPDEVPILRQQGLLIEDTPAASGTGGDENPAPVTGATVKAPAGKAGAGKDA